MIRYTYEFKNVVERTPQYRKVMKLVKNCMKDGGVVDFNQTGTILKENVKKSLRTNAWVKVKRHLGVYDIKLELEK